MSRVHTHSVAVNLLLFFLLVMVSIMSSCAGVTKSSLAPGSSPGGSGTGSSGGSQGSGSGTGSGGSGGSNAGSGSSGSYSGNGGSSGSGSSGGSGSGGSGSGSGGGTGSSGSGSGGSGSGSGGGSGSSGGSGSPAPTPTSHAAPRFLVFEEILGTCCSDRGSGDVAAMKFDPATASLGPAMEPSDFSDMMQGGLAYRNAASGTTIYAAQLPGGPEVQEPNGEAFSIDATAKLTPLPGNPFLAGSSAQSIAMHPSGNFVYFSQQDLNQSGIAGYSIGATGIPQLLPGSPFSRSQVGDAGMAVEPRGRFLFALPLGTEIYTFPIRTDGTLEAPRVTVSSDTESVSGCTCLQVSPDGKYLYAASDSVITAFSIDPQSGALTPVPGASVPAGNQITSFAMSSDGSFLFASDCCDSTILVFATNRSTTGILTPASSLPGPPTGSGPFPIATHGPFVFVGSSITQNDFTGSTVTGTISVYALDSTSGMLTFKGSFPTPGGPETIIAVP